MESRFETAIKRIITITIVDQDVNNIEEILKLFLSGRIHRDPKLIQFTQGFLTKIMEQQQRIRKLEFEDELEEKKRIYELLNKSLDKKIQDDSDKFYFVDELSNPTETKKDEEKLGLPEEKNDILDLTDVLDEKTENKA